MASSGSSLTAGDLEIRFAEDEEVLDVLDLPQLYTKPTAKVLLSTLADISSNPPSWEATPRNGTSRIATPRSPLSGTATPLRKRRKVRPEGLPSYLTNIVSSSLAWIEDDQEKEQVWEAASVRLSERSGRTAMGAISRNFIIPLPPTQTTSDTDVFPDDAIELTLHEPALTADNLGLKTWASSYLLAKRMSTLRAALPPLAGGTTILELGAGTGLVGLAAGAILQAHVVLTDLPEIVPNLERNVHANSALLATFHAKADTAVLDWTDPGAFRPTASESRAAPNQFPLILAADPIYSPEHPRLLVQAVDYHLSKNEVARVVVEMPLREAYGHERDDFRQCMQGIGLRVLDDGEEIGYDDWACGRDEDDLTEVRCWWSVWSRR